MALVLSEDFNGGANGAAMTTANTVFDQTVGSGWTFSTLQLLPSGLSQSGRLAVTVAAVSSATASHTAKSEVFLSIYAYIDVMPTGNVSWIEFGSGVAPNIKCHLRLGVGGSGQLRNSGQVNVHSIPTGTFPLDAWCRIEYEYSDTNATQRVRIYSDTNVHGSVPDYDSGDVATTAAGTANRYRMGLISSQTGTFFYQRLRLDDAVMPAQIATGASAVLAMAATSSLAVAGRKDVAATLSTSATAAMSIAGLAQKSSVLSVSATPSLVISALRTQPAVLPVAANGSLTIVNTATGKVSTLSVAALSSLTIAPSAISHPFTLAVGATALMSVSGRKDVPGVWSARGTPTLTVVVQMTGLISMRATPVLVLGQLVTHPFAVAMSATGQFFVLFQVIIPDYRPHDEAEAVLLDSGRRRATVTSVAYLAVLLDSGRRDAIIQPHQVAADVL